jgi:RNA polymerase sigma factor (sigma-70 family)
LTEQEIIQGCKSGDRRAQKALYDKYSAKMFGVCKRYVKSIESAEDVLVEAFYKVFNKIDMFSNEGSFEGWIRRVVVNESLMFLRKNYRFNEHVEIDEVPVQAETVNIEDQLSANEILRLLDKLPTGYRTVFNLYVLEGLKHKEIAELLEISINTSKSQLILAKKRLKDLVENASIVNLKANN